MNFQKLFYRKLANFRGQSKLLRCRLTAKLFNMRWYSNLLQVDKDASFHLRSYLVDLDENVDVIAHKCLDSTPTLHPPPPTLEIKQKAHPV